MWLTKAGLTIGRFLMGVGSGLTTPALSVFIAETVPNEDRSRLGTCVNLGIIIAFFLSTAIQIESLPRVDDE